MVMDLKLTNPAFSPGSLMGNGIMVVLQTKLMMVSFGVVQNWTNNWNMSVVRETGVFVANPAFHQVMILAPIVLLFKFLIVFQLFFLFPSNNTFHSSQATNTR